MLRIVMYGPDPTENHRLQELLGDILWDAQIKPVFREFTGEREPFFTYVKNKEVELKDKPHEISGMLLYAKTDEETYPDNDYKMSGNKIGVHTLDLNVEFSQIREQLDEIATRHLAYVKA